MLGETNPADSKPGTIRGDYCITVGRHPKILQQRTPPSLPTPHTSTPPKPQTTYTTYTTYSTYSTYIYTTFTYSTYSTYIYTTYTQVGRNICHGSDAVESANHEIGLWFRPEDVCDYTPMAADWVYGDN